MANMSLKKVSIPEQEPCIRNKNFGEVSLGYTAEMAMEEATRCLNCRHKPCILGCPVNVKIPEFIQLVATGDFVAAYNKITETNSLPAVCGRVCPQESQCEGKCVRAIKGESVGIGRLERFCADYVIEHGGATVEKPVLNNHKVAVLGAGPSGLSCAGDMAKKGYDVTIYEAFHTTGGVLIYGIPEFRLPKSIVNIEVNKLVELGVKIKLNAVAGAAVSIDELFEEGYESIFIGTGAGLPSFMNIEGENLNGVYSANEFLTRINLMKAFLDDHDTPYKKHNVVAVVGGGNVAMDSARCAKRLGADTHIIYRRALEEMPARQEEVHHAMEEEIIFDTLVNPVRILGDDSGNVVGIECVKMVQGEPDASGRCRPVVVEGSNFVIDTDAVIMSIGTSPNPIITSNTPNLDTNKWGCIVADETGATSIPGVYAGGDAVTGAATVILAMGAGKIAADNMDKYIKEKNSK